MRAAVDTAASQISAAIEALRRRHQLGPLPILAAPHVLPLHRRAEIAHACEQVRSALLRIATDARWHPSIPIPDGLEPLLASEPLTLSRLPSCRLDALCEADGSGLQFLELQAGDPSGAGWSDVIAAALAEVPALAEVMSHYEPLLRARSALLLEAGGRGSNVAVVNEDTSFVLSDSEAMAHLLRGCGLEAKRVDPRNLTWTGTRLTCGGQAFDVVLRDSHEELTWFRAETQSLWRAFEAGFPRLNPFRDVWFDDKACFARLWEARATLPHGEREAVERCVPRTLLVSAAHLDELRANRPQWVLKPAVGFGGFEVVIGQAVEPAAWEAALAVASTRRTVAQQFVPVARSEVARLENGGIAWRPQHVTVSFWCHGGVFSGGFARAGDQPVVNVHQGGGIGPLVFV